MYNNSVIKIFQEKGNELNRSSSAWTSVDEILLLYIRPRAVILLHIHVLRHAVNYWELALMMSFLVHKKQTEMLNQA